MNVRELYNKIKNSGKDFFDWLIKDEQLLSLVSNTEALDFLQQDRPSLHKYLCKEYDRFFIEKLSTMSIEEVNEIYPAYLFVFNNGSDVNNDIARELSDLSENNELYIYSEDELWKITIVILASHFKPMREYLEEKISRL